MRSSIFASLPFHSQVHAALEMWKILLPHTPLLRHEDGHLCRVFLSPPLRPHRRIRRSRRPSLMRVFIFYTAGPLESEQIFILPVCRSTPQQVTAVIQPAWCFTLSFTHPHSEPVPSTLLCSTFTNIYSFTPTTLNHPSCQTGRLWSITDKADLNLSERLIHTHLDQKSACFCFCFDIFDFFSQIFPLSYRFNCIQ